MIIRQLPQIAVFAFALMAFSSIGAVQAETPSPWMVLVGDRSGDSDKAQWRTILSDGEDVLVADAPLIVRDGRAYRIEKKVYKWKRTFYKGKASAEYEVEELLARDLQSGKATVLVPAGNALSEAKQCVAQGTFELQNPGQAFVGATAADAAGRGCSYERRITILSVYDDLISVHDHNYSFVPFAAHPNFAGDYDVFRFDGRHLKPAQDKFLSKDVERRAHNKLRKKEIGQCVFAGDTGPHAEMRPECFAGYAVSPAGGGAKLEYAVSGFYGAHYDVDDTVSVPLAADYPRQRGEAQRAFVRNHPQFLDWKKLPFYSVAPDGSGVVYKAAGKLYWKRTEDGKVSTLATVNDVRGVQWVQSPVVKKEVNAVFLQPKTASRLRAKSAS